ncbi:hypothetical protein EJB05_22658, partial [Eragrostis curvula]
MEQPRVGGGKVVAFDEAMVGRRRNGSLSAYHDIDAGRVARPLQPHAASRRRTYADGELDVFAAERYFKGAMDGVNHHCKEDGAAVVVPPPATLEMTSARPAVAVAKPAGSRASAASSATSANSQTVLLRGQRGHRDDKKCCVQVGLLMRSCSGKRSVRVDGGAAKEKELPGAGEPAASMIDWYRELRMQKAALGVVAGGDGTNRGGVVAAAAGLPPSLSLGGTAKVAAIGREVILEEKAAEFTNSNSRRRSFTLVAPVRATAPPASGGCGGNEHDDDGAGSESSSDLFEIKSLMIDDCPYEPSEASIQWSVATASAADASSERVSARWIGDGGRGGGGRGQVAAGRQHRDRPAGLLSGCVSHRAVDVSAATTKAPAAVAMRRRGEGFQKARNKA